MAQVDPDGGEQQPRQPEEDPFASEDTGVEQARRELHAKLGAIRQSNQAKYRALLAQGEVPDSGAILITRLETLLEMLLDGDARLAFDLGFEQRMTTVLNECLASARQRQLLVPAPKAAPPGLIVPGS